MSQEVIEVTEREIEVIEVIERGPAGPVGPTAVTSVGISGSDGIEVDSGSPVTGSGTIALGVNAATLRSHINVEDGANNYIHPNHSGEVTSAGDGATTIANDVVTNAKLANVATSTIKGRATAGTGDPEDLSASDVRTILNVADGAEANVQSNWTEADSGSDAFILNKPSTFTPSTHASTHATGGSDAIAPSDIGAQSLFEFSFIISATTLSAGRARIFDVSNYGSAYTIELPITNSQEGDIAVFRSTNLINAPVTIRYTPLSGLPVTLATITKVGEQYRFIYRAAAQEWSLIAVDTHTHPASDITSGTLTHERGGLEADVSTYDGLIKISGGATSAVTVTTAGEALLDDASASDQRVTLGLGTAAVEDSNAFATASHAHGNITNDGKIGSTSGLPIKTGTSGVLEAGSFGTTAGTFCEGNDSRLQELITLTFSHTNHNPAAGGQTYYMGLPVDLSPNLTSTTRVFRFPFPCIVVGGTLTVNVGSTLAIGASGSSVINLWNVTQGTGSLLVGSIDYSSQVSNYSFGSLSILVDAAAVLNDFAIQIISPTFSTAPTVVRRHVVLVIQKI